MSSRISYKKIALSITGFSCPVFGISWNPPKNQRAIARKLITFLEDRRVLTQDHHREFTSHVTSSVLAIREEITRVLQDAPENEVLVDPMRKMRGACRRYLDRMGADDQGLVDQWGDPISFALSLGELRASFGLHIARLCVAYGINPEDELSKLLPAIDKDTDD